MYERSYGSKYDSNLNTTQIAALVRAQIKEKVQKFELPPGKYSVTSEYFSGGSSIRVSIKDLDPRWPVFGIDYLNGDDSRRRYSLATQQVISALKEMLDAYNHDGSETMVDYFDVKFYGSVDLDWKFERSREEFERTTKRGAA